MRKIFLQQLVLISALAVCFSTNLLAVDWSGNVNTNVLNDSIALKGNVTFTADVSVTINDGSTRTVTPDGTYFLTHAASEKLTLQVTNGTLLFDLTAFDLSFQGATNPFEVFVQGTGAVVFRLAGGRTVSFKEGAAGTKVYVVMGNPGPSVGFTRVGLDSDNVFINIGKDSLFTYVEANQLGAGGASDTGSIIFDPTNPSNSTGRMVLTIADKGGMVVASHWYDGSTVHLNIPGAGQPVFQVQNVGEVANANAGMMVVNNNQTLFDLSIDPWCTGVYSGTRYGFVLANNALLNIMPNTYFDYVGTATNQCPDPVITCTDATPASSFVKERNPSAFFVDGISTTSNAAAIPAEIDCNTCTALVFRSGVDKFGVIENPLGMTYSDTTFTVAPENKTLGAGNLVFDVEGLLEVVGSGVSSSKMEVLSLSVDPTGANLLSSGLSNCPLIFPLRNFAIDLLGNYLAYNSAYFLFNNNMTLNDISLVHTDQNHYVSEKNDTTSEPTYVGGESFTLKTDILKPQIIFDNANLLVQENIAFTGVDLLVTNFACDADNISNFIFFQNGYKIDDGTGRQMILGTCIGASSCDGCSIICKDAQLDVMQSFTCSEPCSALQLNLTTTVNDATIVQDIADTCTQVPLACQLSVHTIYLGNSSNISIGKQETITGCPLATFDIAGNFFSIDTRGGNKNSPENSNITGQGGIFVDNLGLFTIEPTMRANISTMVTKSGSGDINLPKNQVFFHDRIGIADWWRNPAAVGPTQCLSDYTINWMALEKQYCDFIPYIPCSYDSCPATCPAVLPVNIDVIPTVYGSVEQLQIKASRIGDPVHVKVDGGYVREIVFLTGCHSAEAPTAVLVLQNQGRVGLGTANKNPDSTQTSGLLGVNGITIVANGDGRVDLNSDLVINNVCHILKGPDFVETNTLTFYSEVPHKITIKEGAVLDLSSFGFTTTQHSIKFAGQITLVFEPGSHLVLGTAADSIVGMGMFDKSVILILPDRRSTYPCSSTFCPAPTAGHPCSSTFCPAPAAGFAFKGRKHLRACTPGTSVTNTDEFRVKYHGVGEILLTDQSRMDIPKYALLGIENWASAGLLLTDINFHLKDAGSVFVGNEQAYLGGALQVGNTTDVDGGSVNWNVQFDGADTKFTIGAQGLLAFALGVVDKSSSLPNDWCLASLYNVDTIGLDITNGTFQHNMVYRGDDARASLLAIGTGPAYNFFLSTQTPNQSDYSVYGFLVAGHMLGGGNLALDTTPSDTPRSLPVLDADTLFPTNPSVSIMRSHTYYTNGANLIAVPASTLMANLRVIQANPNVCPYIAKNVIGPSSLQDYARAGLAFVTNTFESWLVRQEVNYIQAISAGDQFSSQIDALTAAKYTHGGSKPVLDALASLPSKVIVRLFSYL